MTATKTRKTSNVPENEGVRQGVDLKKEITQFYSGKTAKNQKMVVACIIGDTYRVNWINTVTGKVDTSLFMSVKMIDGQLTTTIYKD